MLVKKPHTSGRAWGATVSPQGFPDRMWSVVSRREMAEPGPQAGEMDWQTDEQTGAKTAPIAAKWAEPTVSRGGVVGVVPGPHAPPRAPPKVQSDLREHEHPSQAEHWWGSFCGCRPGVWPLAGELSSRSLSGLICCMEAEGRPEDSRGLALLPAPPTQPHSCHSPGGSF